VFFPSLICYNTRFRIVQCFSTIAKTRISNLKSFLFHPYFSGPVTIAFKSCRSWKSIGIDSLYTEPFTNESWKLNILLTRENEIFFWLLTRSRVSTILILPERVSVFFFSSWGFFFSCVRESFSMRLSLYFITTKLSVSSRLFRALVVSWQRRRNRIQSRVNSSS